MPKIKSHKAAQKRIGVTGSGKTHFYLEAVARTRRTRRYAGKALIKDVHENQVRRLLPYL